MHPTGSRSTDQVASGRRWSSPTARRAGSRFATPGTPRSSTSSAPQPADAVLYKHRFSGFYGTELDAVLRGLGVRTLVFTGCTTSVCVESTLRDAFFRDYRCV